MTSELIEQVARASEKVERLSRELDITNADHIALWLEGNTIQDEPMSQCVSWLACRIVEAHERAIAAMQADAAEQAAEVADYLKEGETIAECIARNRADANVLLEMFAAERVKVENYAKTMKIISDIANRETAELAKFKALAETLAGALEEAAYSVGMSSYDRHKVADKALLQYKEARDA